MLAEVQNDAEFNGDDFITAHSQCETLVIYAVAARVKIYGRPNRPIFFSVTRIYKVNRA